MTKLTSAIMTAAANMIEANLPTWDANNRAYYVCFAVEDSSGFEHHSDDMRVMRDELEALLRRDGKSLDGVWFKESEGPGYALDFEGFVEPGPERQKLRIEWCRKIAAELEAQGHA